jgi:hypothetical protein
MGWLFDEQLSLSRVGPKGNVKQDNASVVPWFYKESPRFYQWLRETYMYHVLGQVVCARPILYSPDSQSRGVFCRSVDRASVAQGTRAAGCPHAWSATRTAHNTCTTLTVPVNRRWCWEPSAGCPTWSGVLSSGCW